MCQVIAITNQKGGVGKTTTTFHLGTKLAQEGKRVLLIDADPQASLTASFGIRDADTLNITLTNALQAIVEDEPIDPAIGIRTHEEGAKLFPANIELASFETAMINVMSREYIMREFVNTHRPNFDYILIDCMPSLGMLTVNALAAADSVIIRSRKTRTWISLCRASRIMAFSRRSRSAEKRTEGMKSSPDTAENELARLPAFPPSEPKSKT